MTRISSESWASAHGKDFRWELVSHCSLLSLPRFKLLPQYWWLRDIQLQNNQTGVNPKWTIFRNFLKVFVNLFIKHFLAHVKRIVWWDIYRQNIQAQNCVRFHKGFRVGVDSFHVDLDSQDVWICLKIGQTSRRKGLKLFVWHFIDHMNFPGRYVEQHFILSISWHRLVAHREVHWKHGSALYHRWNVGDGLLSSTFAA